MSTTDTALRGVLADSRRPIVTASRPPAPKPRIAVLTDAVHPWHTGGKETRQHELLPRLADRGFDIVVYTMKWWPEPGDRHIDGVTYRAICPKLPLYHGSRRSILQALVFSAASLRLLTQPFDALEADMVPVLHLFPARLVTRIRRRPLIVTWHEFWGRRYWVEYLHGAKGHLAGLLEAHAARLPDVILAASEGTRLRLLDLTTRADGSVATVPNGVDADALGPVRERIGDVGGPRQPANLVVVGRLLQHKNVDVALSALRLLRDSGDFYTMSIIGEGPDRGRLEALTRELRLEDAVTFVGTMPDHVDVLAAMAEARALVFPSSREGFGIVALEAMALGTPVVTSDAPDNFARHLVRSGVDGEVCSARPNAVATAVRSVVADRDARSAAATRAAAGYSWDALADRAAEVYISHTRRPARRGGRA